MTLLMTLRKGMKVNQHVKNSFFVLLLMLTLFPHAVPTSWVDVRKLQPLLLDVMYTEPTQRVNLIVQKQYADLSVEALITKLGGTVTSNFEFIHAFAAELEASKLGQLATHPNVRSVSLDAPVVKSGWDGGVCKDKPCYDTTYLTNAYVRAVRADQVWNGPGYLQGQNIGVAVVDSGTADHEDFKQYPGGNGDLRIRKTALFVTGSDQNKDWYGHGTHVAGIIGGNGSKGDGTYIGIAPRVNLISVDVANDQGASNTSNVISALQWVLNNKQQYNIRVVNISFNSSVAESYHTSPLSAAVEILWFNGIVVVVSAGNNGSGASNGIPYPPANDPFVITVGATDDRGTAGIADDTIPAFSASGVTEAGFVKPELVAPGTNIISTLAKADSNLATTHPGHKLPDPNKKDYYFRMSGTSMAAPVVSGAVALLLQDEPGLTPDQVKFRLMATANKTWGGYNATRAGAGYLDIYAAINGTTTASANTGVTASQKLWTGSQPVTWGNVNWNSVNWNSVNWNSVNWNSVNWNSVNWNSDYWDN